MKPFHFFVLISTLVSLGSLLSLYSTPDPVAPTPASFESILSEADQSYGQGDFLQAHLAYRRALPYDRSELQDRLLSYRLADSLWRIPLEIGEDGPERAIQARRSLEELIRSAPSPKDPVLPLAHLSLADLLWKQSRPEDRKKAWKHYQAADYRWEGEILALPEGYYP